MKPIQNVENLIPEAIELFEATGYYDVQKISEKRVSDITFELMNANHVLKIVKHDLTSEMIKNWLEQIESKYGFTMNDEHLDLGSFMTFDPNDILSAPKALAISPEFTKDNNIQISDLPEGNIHFRDKELALAYLAKNKPNTISYDVLAEPEADVLEPPAEEEKTVLFEHPNAKKNEAAALDMSRVIKMETYQTEGSSIEPIVAKPDINFIRTTDKKTNEGVSHNSRFYIKGVLHKDASKFKSGCHLFLLANIMVFLSLATTSLVFVDSEKYSWAVWGPLLMVVSALIYFASIKSSKCPVCNQRQFAPKTCFKHKKAHRWPIFGYMLPTAIHAILFKWFRCIFCGTSIRLKK